MGKSVAAANNIYTNIFNKIYLATSVYNISEVHMKEFMIFDLTVMVCNEIEFTFKPIALNALNLW